MTVVKATQSPLKMKFGLIVPAFSNGFGDDFGLFQLGDAALEGGNAQAKLPSPGGSSIAIVLPCLWGGDMDSPWWGSWFYRGVQVIRSLVFNNSLIFI